MDARTQCFQLVMEHAPVFIDMKTTGLDSTAEIVDIAIIDWHGHVLVDTLVKPAGPICPFATKKHGISAETVNNAPHWPEVLDIVQQALAGKLGVIYNLDFNIRMMFQSCAPWKINPQQNFGAVGFFCAMKEYSHWVQCHDIAKRTQRWIKLEKAAEREGIQVMQSHRALSDCFTCLNVVRSVRHRIEQTRRF